MGLTKDPDSLVEIRRSRLKLLREEEETRYVDPEQVREEVQDARRFFARIGCPVIDVTRRSDPARKPSAEIMMLLNKRALEKKVTAQGRRRRHEKNEMLKAGVVGWPIEHSLSPRLHGYWLKAHGIAGSL